MPIFQYRALKNDGSEMEGIVEADSAREARSELRERNLHVKEIDSAIEEEEEEEQFSLRRFFSRKKHSELAHMTRQLSTMIRAGVPLADCLTALIEQTETHGMEAVLRDVREQVTQGETFADALAAHPKYFDNLFTSMVRAGEKSGELEDVMHRLSVYLRSQNRLRQRVIAALTYPAIVMLVGIGIIIVLLTWILPQILTILEKSGEALPIPTQILVTASSIFQSYWWLILAGMIGIWVVFKGFASTRKGKYMIDLFLLKIPLLGKLFRKAAISRFAATFATLLESGLSVMESLEVVEDILNNAVLAETIRDAREDIMGGSRVAQPIREAEFFPSTLAYMIGIGEESGQMEELLETISDAYDEELEVTTEQLTSLLEPIMIIIIAGGVFFVAISILMPLMEMGQL